MALTPFFSPRGIAVIGASTSPEKLGYGVARNLVESKYQGAIHFVSQKHGELFGHALYTSINDVPDPVDLAVLVVPNVAMPDAIETCGKRGIHAAIIIAGGFREVGVEGAALEQKCLEAARRYNIRLLGPNCIGVIDTHLPFDTTFVQPPMPAQGGIGFISHSGAFCASIIDWARAQGFGFSQLISLGNQADINETDALPEVAQDEHTHVIVMYMESISDGKRFVKAASKVTKDKPVIALKVGRFESGQKAAASHTGALAASDTAFNAAFAKAGVLRADTAEQMFDWARALENCPLPSGKRIAILTNAGGPGVIAADSLETNNLLLAQLSDSTLKDLSAALPLSASTHNPVDMLASASPEVYATCLQFLLRDENVDGVMVILPPPPMFKAEEVAEKIVKILASDYSLSTSGKEFGFKKPVVIALMGSSLIEEAEKVFQRAHVPTYPFPERAASALSALYQRTKFLTAKNAKSAEISKITLADSASKNLDEIIASYGITTAPIKLTRDESEAVTIAKELGFPVVMKIASPDISHKSDIGGVLLDVNSEEEVRAGYTLLMERAKKSAPNARIEGTHIQHQASNGQEVIVGMARDPQFGPLMMFGSGGIEVEGIKDVAFALGPLNQAEAEEMIYKTWAGRKLKGFRSIPPVDEEAVRNVLIKLSRLAMAHEEIEEIEINPLRVLSKGAVALDVRVKLK